MFVIETSGSPRNRNCKSQTWKDTPSCESVPGSVNKVWMNGHGDSYAETAVLDGRATTIALGQAVHTGVFVFTDILAKDHLVALLFGTRDLDVLTRVLDVNGQ